jgi:hypothetical protein
VQRILSNGSLSFPRAKLFVQPSGGACQLSNSPEITPAGCDQGFLSNLLQFLFDGRARLIWVACASGVHRVFSQAGIRKCYAQFVALRTRRRKNPDRFGTDLAAFPLPRFSVS